MAGHGQGWWMGGDGEGGSGLLVEPYTRAAHCRPAGDDQPAARNLGIGDGNVRRQRRRAGKNSGKGSGAKNSANGTVVATTRALRRLPRNNHCTKKISTMPKAILCRTVRVVTLISSLRS